MDCASEASNERKIWSKKGYFVENKQKILQVLPMFIFTYMFICDATKTHQQLYIYIKFLDW